MVHARFFGCGVSTHTKELVSYEKKETKSSILFTATEFEQSKSGTTFQRVQIWNYRQQKPKKNYGRHPL
jgi:hypothetical protein